MRKCITLKTFNDSELILNNEEKIAVLKFIFKSKQHIVDQLAINNRMRSFAQGLLLEAIDASYALGFVDVLFKSVTQPSLTMKKAMDKFAKESFKHWFGHAVASDLLKVKIYEIVRRDLERAFSSILIMHLNGTARNRGIFSGFITYDTNKENSIIWG
ncbi:hypothetical protein [Endozoicomonas numazuensis]|uniref:hypothetical protein n=1 Tax=Endozoicomonas numazuensis TaxID=1137799 RepID=UPI00068D3F6E|nr:hypothetical protein [Endozoicomonas numazuensis]